MAPPEEETAAMKAPLLEPVRLRAEAQAIAGDEEEEEGNKGFGRRLLEENKKLWVVAGPSICTRFSTFGLTVISQAFIGHIGATELAAYALVSTVLMRFSHGILVSKPSTLYILTCFSCSFLFDLDLLNCVVLIVLHSFKPHLATYFRLYIIFLPSLIY